MSNAAPGTAGDAAAAAAAAPAEPGTPPAAGAAPSPADAAAQAATAATQAASDAGAAAGQGGAQLDTTGWPAEAVTAYEKARADAAKYQREAGDQRINAKRNAAAEESKRLLALIQGVIDPNAAAEAAPTVESLTTAIQGKDGTIGDLGRQNAAIAEAWSQGVDPAKLGYLQYQLSTDKDFGALDPSADDFGAKVKASIAALVAKDQTLKLPGGAAASGVESFGGANGSTAISQDAFNAMSMAEKSKLYSADKATYDKLAGNAS